MPNAFKGEKVVNTGVWYTEDGTKTTGAEQVFPFAGPDGTGVARAQLDLDKAKGYVAAPKAQFFTDQVGITETASLSRL